MLSFIELYTPGNGFVKMLFLQGGNNLPVGNGEGVLAQFFRGDPAIGVGCAGSPFHIAAVKGVEGDPEVGVGMTHAADKPLHSHIDLQLFTDFSDDRISRGLSLFQLSTREFP